MWKQFFLPTNLDTALALKAQYGAEARFIAGGTDLVVDLERGRQPACVLIDISRIESLQTITLEETGLRLGAGVTHASILQSPEIAKYAPVLAQAAIEVGAPQIRNRSTLVGNLVTASPAADTVPSLLALNAVVELISVRGKRTLAVNNFITGFRQVDLAPDELVYSILIPYPSNPQHSAFLKLGLRKAQAISVISVTVVLEFEPDAHISRAAIVLGSVAPTPLLVPEAEKILVGQSLSDELIQTVATFCMEAATPIADVRGSAAYRKQMVKVLTGRALRYIQANKVPPPSADPHVFLQLPAFNPASTLSFTTVEATQPLALELNAKSIVIENADNKVLLYALRQAGFNGTKEGCFEGECGACTVLLNGKAVNSCLVPAHSAYGCEVRTVEGLANEQLHPIQQSFIEQGGVQCGFCTPGLLMSGATLLAERPEGSTEWEQRSALVGNLCRCTGYNKVLAALDQAQTL
jgi:carbon-monoxide dehydrogenase medium subunit